MMFSADYSDVKFIEERFTYIFNLNFDPWFVPKMYKYHNPRFLGGLSLHLNHLIA